MSNENRNTAIDTMLHELEHALLSSDELRFSGCSDMRILVRAFSAFVDDYGILIRLRDNEIHVTIEGNHVDREWIVWDDEYFDLDARFSLKSLPGIFIAYTCREPFVYYSIHRMDGG